MPGPENLIEVLHDDAGAALRIGDGEIYRVRKIVALGRSFPAHAIEGGNEPVSEPLLFAKSAENLVGSGTPVVLPSGDDDRVEIEVEVACVVANDIRRASAVDAIRAVAGFTIVNDVTWRSEQARAKKHGHPWFLAKNLPGAIPVGPRLVAPEEIDDVRRLRLITRIDDVVVQETDFAGMMRGVDELLAWVSWRVPLRRGDLVSFGTPPGVCAVRPGQRVAGDVEGLGILVTDFVAEEYEC